MINIVTPTYRGHFSNIKIYLESFKKYAIKESGWQIVFTISADEEDEFRQLVYPYKEILPIKILIFENLLNEFNVQSTSENLLRRYGKFSYQTLKKFYTLLTLSGRYSLVLDSETELVRPTSIKDIFKQFFEDPFISYSSLSIRKPLPRFLSDVVENRNKIFNANDAHLFLESFDWFYDKEILKDLFSDYGSPIEIVETIKRTRDPDRRMSGVFEIDLYDSYIYLNNDKYNYRLVNVEFFLDNLNLEDRERYYDEWMSRYQGNAGLMEHALMFLTKSNVKVLAKAFRESGFNVIRCEKSNFRISGLQYDFMKEAKPNILAASQNHFFGCSSEHEMNNKYMLQYRMTLQHLQERKNLTGKKGLPCSFYLIYYQLKSFLFNKRLASFRKRYENMVHSQCKN